MICKYIGRREGVIFTAYLVRVILPKGMTFERKVWGK